MPTMMFRPAASTADRSSWSRSGSVAAIAGTMTWSRSSGSVPAGTAACATRPATSAAGLACHGSLAAAGAVAGAGNSPVQSSSATSSKVRRTARLGPGVLAGPAVRVRDRQAADRRRAAADRLVPAAAGAAVPRPVAGPVVVNRIRVFPAAWYAPSRAKEQSCAWGDTTAPAPRRPKRNGARVLDRSSGGRSRSRLCVEHGGITSAGGIHGRVRGCP